jgi:uncharacterized membrane protein
MSEKAIGARPGRFHSAAAIGAKVLARLAEVALAILGIVYTTSDASVSTRALRYLAWWDLVAFAYLGVGFIVVRRASKTEDPTPATPRDPHWWHDLQRRLSFLLVVVASLTGLTAAADVLNEGVRPDLQEAVKIVGVSAVVFAWTLLHVGYATFYRNLDAGADGPGLRFPDRQPATTADYIYFSLTLGVSFAVSDVEIIRRRTRWHVLVHEVLSFFYNTAVLAIAVGVVTGH